MPESSADHVAFPGEAGAHSHRAIRTLFGPDRPVLPRSELEDVGQAVVRGRAGLGILPMEMTATGPEARAYDVLAIEGIEVVGEVILPVHHALLGLPGSSLTRVEKVLSHPVALAQCSRFFADHPGVEASATWDTAGAAREVAEMGDPSRAALADADAAGLYGLDVVERDLQDDPHTVARYFLVARAGTGPLTLPGSGPPRTALLLEILDEPGALVRVLTPFAAQNVNLGRIETRPASEVGDYRFFLELDAAGDDPDAVTAIDEAQRHARALRLLGSYHSWSPEE